MSVLIFLVILAFLIFIHELGHFLAAKMCGMKVTEFAIGFKPALIQKKIGETNYVLGMLPFGGYVSIPGEDGNKPEDQNDVHRLYSNKPWWQKIFVLLAGVTMNLLGAVFVFTVLFLTKVEVPTSEYPFTDFKETRTIITSVLTDTPAQQVGITAGSEILASVAGDVTLLNPSPDMFIKQVQKAAGAEITLVTKYRGEETTVQITPAEIDNTYRIGISLEEIGYTNFPFTTALKKGFESTYQYTIMTFQSLGNLIMALFESDQELLGQVAGPIGIVSIVSEAQKEGFSYILFVTALLSINLAVLNVLPIPALDGGRVVLVFLELITRNRIPQSILQGSISYSFYALIVLMIVVSIQDILRLF